MILTIVSIYLALWMAFVWMVKKLPDKFGWGAIGIMIALIVYLPITITISKIIPSCLTMQKYNTLKSFLEDSGIASEEFLKKN